jgi:hypothetical protein
MLVEIKAKYNAMIEDLFDEIYKAIAEYLGVDDLKSVTAINRDVVKIIQEQGFMYLQKYSDDVRKKVQTSLIETALTGENYFFATLKAKKMLGESFEGNLHRLIRNETAKLMQEATWRGLKAHEKQIATLEWHGILDNKTTDWCKNRMALNPWYFEVVEQQPATFKEAKKLLEQYERDKGLPVKVRVKPLDVKTDELFDPKTGTFMHPHINCRKNWIGYPEFNYDEEIKKAKSLNV